MKSIRKCISVLLALVLCFACAAPAGVSAEDAPVPGAYPESAHPYADNMNQTWTYTHPTEAEQLFVTFSKDTYIEQWSPDADLEWKNGDSLWLEPVGDDTDWLDRIYFNDTFDSRVAGNTLLFPASAFEIHLVSDERVTGYGFSIDRISDQPPVDICAVRFAVEGQAKVAICAADAGKTEGWQKMISLGMMDLFDHLETADGIVIGWQAPTGSEYYYSDEDDQIIPVEDLVPGEIVDFQPIVRPYEETVILKGTIEGEDWTSYYLPGRRAMLPPIYGEITASGAIIGWETDAGISLYYDRNERSVENAETLDAMIGKTVTLTTPICCPLSIRPEETFTTGNSNGQHNYYMTDAQKQQIFRKYAGAMALTPFAPVGLLLGFLTSKFYPQWPMGGVCAAFPQLILLQHYGKVDLPGDFGVENMSDLSLYDEDGWNEELSGAISYYNGVSQGGFICCNMAIEPGSKAFIAQSKAMYEAVAGGKPVVVFYFPSSRCHPFTKERMQQNLNYLKARDFSGLVENIVGLHSVLLTGAYTRADGSHVFFGYDSNRGGDYAYGWADSYKMSADFSNFSLGAYNWTADPDVFTPFRLDQPTNPILYAKNFFRSLIGLITKKPF